ncbi:MAG: formyltransferase [Ferrovum sp.]|jgi:methionyl-tRNA formyltransferase|nr:formyltransferase [Ferrovum sp.]
MPDKVKNPVRVVVFAYHSVGVRCLEVLHRFGVDIALIVTHPDDPAENRWFDSVAEWAAHQGIPALTPLNPNDPALVERIAALHADFFFSFYYRQMLGADLLALPKRGAYNLHGSLLPRYRGRVPVNWAVICGETETGATLHVMTLKPDQGDIVAQEKVSIGPDDTAHEVFLRVIEAGERALSQVLPALLSGKAVHHRQDLSQGNYCGGRRPEDGRIDWSQPAQTIHNLVRGVAPPYPGAFTLVDGQPLRILRTSLHPHPDALAKTQGGDGQPLYLLQAEWQKQDLDAAQFKSAFPQGCVPGPWPTTKSP